MHLFVCNCIRIRMEFKILYIWSYWSIFLITVFYFLLLYFGLGALFNQTCKWLSKKGYVSKIVSEDVSSVQLKREIKNSLLSIILFGFSSVALIYLIRNGIYSTAINTPFSVGKGLLILTIWNELHFFIVHRIMHLPFFMKTVHKVHHVSRIPTVYSIYSFHWFEALLLSTVPLTILWYTGFPSLVFVFFPVISLLINLAGHCNYRYGKGLGPDWWLFATRHSQHHSKGKRNYGFASSLLDKLFNRITKNG